MKLEHIIQILTSLTFLLFGKDVNILHLLLGLCILMIFDIITGMTYAITKGSGLKSAIFNAGIIKKVSILILISLTNFIDQLKLFNLSISLESATISFFLVGEVISSLENLQNIGIPMPDILKKIIRGEINGK